MKYSLLPATLLLLLSAACSSKTKNKPEADLKDAAATGATVSVITEKHINIPNSSLYIIPPAGFAASELSGTLTQTDGTAHFAQMKIISGYSREQLFAGFKSEAEKNFPGTWKEEQVTIGGHPAIIYHSKTAAYSQYFLAFSNDYTGEMIIANFEETDITTGQAMYEALKTTVVKQ